MQTDIFFSEPSCWAPGLISLDDWTLWSRGEKSIEKSSASPSIDFTPPLFRRRLSQLCKMTVHVVHDAVEKNACADLKQVFISKRGEINREFTINRTLIQEEMILPAAFSLSVFNAPIALAAIACNLKSGYTTIFPSKGDFHSALLAAAAPVLSGEESKVLLVYGDELVPDDYGTLRPEDNFPLAFATVLSAGEDSVCSKKIPLQEKMTPEDFLRTLLSS
ncbi:MAG: beta-ketoacyl synthase chain length factor [Treponema sp.]|nr:beta-ketoacyl synthase chain length factor [Treponema sp.]